MQRSAPLVLALLLLAGCSSGKAPQSHERGLGEDVDVHVTSTTGAIRGVVVDEAIRPLAGVLVTLSSDPARSANTTETGTFAFSDLQPGAYFIEAKKLGFKMAQASADVVAGDADPRVTRIQMVADASQLPYHVGLMQKGYILCTTSGAAVCGAPNVVSSLLLCDFFKVCVGDVTSDHFGLFFYVDPNATLIQGEMVWDSTQPVSPDLQLSAEDLGSGSNDTCPEPTLAGAPYTEYSSGPSPVLLQTDADEVALGAIGGTCPIYYSVFSGELSGTPAGFTVQQAFNIYVDAFYGYTPADVGQEGWRLSRDGAPPPPPQ